MGRTPYPAKERTDRPGPVPPSPTLRSFPQWRFSYGASPNGPVKIASATHSTLDGRKETHYGPHAVRRDRVQRRWVGVPGGLKKARNHGARAGRRPESQDGN
ncbi:hypothetical protein GCM10009525_50460 [Streptosporangium amethystogenes subsp. fukuiense]